VDHLAFYHPGLPLSSSATFVHQGAVVFFSKNLAPNMPASTFCDRQAVSEGHFSKLAWEVRLLGTTKHE